MATLNKPVVSICDGRALGAGAALHAASGLPYATDNSMISFRDVFTGMTPNGGASFYLSRLPGEVGAYLALTGHELQGGDIIDAGFA